MRSPTLLLMRMKAADTSASRAIADWTPLTLVPRSVTTAEIDTFISEVSTTRTNIAAASSRARPRSKVAAPGTLSVCGAVTIPPSAVRISRGHGRSCRSRRDHASSSVDDDVLEDHDRDPDAAVNERDDERRQAARIRDPTDREAPQEQLHQAGQEGGSDREVDRDAGQPWEGEDDPRHDDRGQHRRFRAGDRDRSRDVDRSVDPMRDDLGPDVGEPERGDGDKQRQADQLRVRITLPLDRHERRDEQRA